MDPSRHPGAAQPTVIVDSSVLIDYLADRRTPETEWLELNLGHRLIGITTLILSEVLQGVRGDRAFSETLGALDLFDLFEAGSREIAIQSAGNYRTLRRQGITIRNTIDCLTATFCILNGFELLQNDRDFAPFEKLLKLEVVRVSASN
jgi:hypothetical protein